MIVGTVDTMSDGTIRTAGVDLAADIKRTALAIIERSDERAQLTGLDLGVSDVDITRADPGRSRTRRRSSAP